MVLLPWTIRNAGIALPNPTEQLVVHSYSTGILHADSGDPSSPRLSWAELAARSAEQLSLVAKTFGTRLGQAEAAGVPALLFAILGFACVACVAALRREPAEFLCLGLFLLLSIYFGFVDRLVLPVFVLALPAMAEVGLRVLRGVWPSSGLPSGVVLAWIAALALVDARRLPDPDEFEGRTRRMRALAEYLEAQVPPGEALAARLGWELGVHLEDRAIYSLYVVAKRDGREGMLAMLDRRGVNFCLFYEPLEADRMLDQALRGRFTSRGSFEGWHLVERRK
jgi:hypothetical protein